MADILPFPSRAQPRVAHVHAREAQPPGEVYRWKDTRRDLWMVEHLSHSGDSSCILAQFSTAERADDFIAKWRREHGCDGPKGAA